MRFISIATFTKIAAVILVIYVVSVLTLGPFYGEDASLSESIALFNNTFVWLMSSFLAAFIALLGIKKLGLKNNIGKSLLFIGLSALSSGIGIIIWDVYIEVLGVELPYPSIADVAWFFQTPFLLIATYYLARLFAPKIEKKFIATGVIAFIIIAPIMVHILGGIPEINFSEAFWASFFDLYYSLTDAISITMVVIILVMAGGRIFPGLIAYMASLILLAIGDILFALRTEAGITFAGDISDLSFNLSGIMLVLAVYMIANTFIERKFIKESN